MAVIYIQALVLVVLFGKLLRKIFFGQLRAAETEHLIERSWYAVTETCLAFTVFRDDFSPRFIALFTVLLFLKCFHWLVEDRVDYMERSPVISLLFHIRAVLLLGLLLALDTFFIHHAYYSTLIKGASVQLVFGFEYAILLTVVATIGVKYVLHTIDLRRENPWENKSVYLLYTELFLGFAKVLLYILFMGIMVKVHTLPLFAIRPMYLTTRAFKKAVHDVIMSRRAIRNMNSLYPDATAEDLEATDNVCIICREEMRGAPAAVAATAGVAAANNNANNNNNGARAKKLPCGHIFHINCLRSWFQRQQTCPTCRIDILRQPAAVPAVAGNRNANEAAAAARAAAVLERVLGPAAFAGGANAVAPPVAAAAAAAAAPDQNQRGRINVAVAQPFAFLPPFFPPPPPATSEGAAAARPPFPALPFPPPFFFPPPPLHGTLAPPSTSDLTSLSADQLRSMESEERSRVEARIHTLRNIQSLLDSAVSQMNLYVASTTTSTTATTITAPNAASAVAASESSTEVAAAAAAATAVAAPDTPASSTAAAAAAAASDAANIPSETATSGLCTNAGPPTAATGAIPKTPIPKLSTKIASSEAASSSKAAGMSGEEKDAEKDDVCSGGGGGGGDAEKDEIRRRRLEKLSVEAVPTAEDGDKFVEEAVE